MWIIAFRNGLFFQHLDAEQGGPMLTAQEFESEAAADKFMERNPWIFFYDASPVLKKEVQFIAMEDNTFVSFLNPETMF